MKMKNDVSSIHRWLSGFLILAAIGCAGGPKPIESFPDAVVQLPFESSLANLSDVEMKGQVHNGNIDYQRGSTGTALHTLGDGGWVTIHPQKTIDVGERVEVSFRFKRDNWINPYVAGSGLQTIATLSSRTEKRMDHVTFGFSPGDDLSLHVSFSDGEGKWHTMGRGALVTYDWHQVLLRIDKRRGTASLYLDGELIEEIPAIPVVMTHGISVIKLGTWFRKNQAYRGLIDDFVIRDIPVSPAKPV